MFRPQFSLRTLLVLSITLGLAWGTFGWWWPGLQLARQMLTPVEERPIAWQPYSPELLANAKESGRPILLTFEADWDITTVANRSWALETPSVRRLIYEYEVIPIQVDCTHHDEEIDARRDDYGVVIPSIVVHSPEANRRPLALNGIQTEQRVARVLRTANRGRPQRSELDIVQSPVLGAVGVMLLLAMAHWLARSEFAQAAGASASSSSSSDSTSASPAGTASASSASN